MIEVYKFKILINTILRILYSQETTIVLQVGDLQETQKSALVFPRLKNPRLNAEDANSYRPISNLRFASKFVELGLLGCCDEVHCTC